jgi:cytochrome c oxidase subunit 2
MLAGIALTLASLWYGQNHGLMPVEASKDAALVDDLFNAMMTVGAGIFFLVEGVILVCIFKFRRKKGDTTDGPPIEGNIPLEILWTAIPVVIVLVIGVYSFEIYRVEGGFDPEAAEQPAIVQVAMLPGSGLEAGLMDAQPAPKGMKHHSHMALGVGGSPESAQNAPDLTVNVLGLQYAWIFTYPDSGVTAGELHIPVGKDIKLTIKAQDVIHAFWLPQFRLKQDAIPGQDAELRFKPTLAGEYPIVCAELCGAYHGAMASKLYVMEQDDYDAWLQQQVAALDEPQTVASKPDEINADAAYLAPFASQFADQTGVDAELLQQLHPLHNHELMKAMQPPVDPAAVSALPAA